MPPLPQGARCEFRTCSARGLLVLAGGHQAQGVVFDREHFVSSWTWLWSFPVPLPWG